MSVSVAIPFVDLRAQYAKLGESVRERINRVLEHGQYIMGPEVTELETALCERTGSRHCITVSSGTEALLISLMAKGISLGDEVITTPFSFAATAEVIALVGATPIFVDIEPDTYNIDASRIEEKISEKTRAIIPVSLYGQAADMAAINEISGRYPNICVIEDAAQSFGAVYDGKASCNLSDIGCTSFFPSKPLGCYGDGGAIFTDDAEVAQACKEIRVHGQSARYLHTRIGVGGRMDTMQCAVVLAKLECFDWEVSMRQKIAQRYDDLITAKLPDVRPTVIRENRTSVSAQYTIAVRDGKRGRVADFLKSMSIPTAIHYPKPLHLQPAYSEFCCPDCCPLSVAAGDSVLSLPMSAYLSESDQDRVVEALSKAFESVA